DMKNISALILAGVVGSGLSALAAVDLSKLPAASSQKDVTYDKDIKPVFEASCFRCHGEKDHKGGIRLDSLEGALKGGKEGKIIEVGNSEKSQIVLAVSQLDPKTAMPPKPRAPRQRGPQGTTAPAGDGRMMQGERPGGLQGTNAPAGGPGQRPMGPPAKPLTPEQVGLVRAWIDQGAK
ncbi:MAG TPA: c-type cytochrome domain-containing protein, partial [Verrucomicrobiae bacterium]